MNEAMRNLAVLLWAVCAMNNNSYAGDSMVIREETVPSQPTIIIGEALTPSGKIREAIVEQPAGAPNPLGNPIVDEDTISDNVEPVRQKVQNMPKDTKPMNLIEQSANSHPLENGEVALPQPSKQIENELYQSGDDIIDVQAYPIEDVKEVTQPNLQPTVVAD